MALSSNVSIVERSKDRQLPDVNWLVERCTCIGVSTPVLGGVVERSLRYRRIEEKRVTGRLLGRKILRIRWGALLKERRPHGKLAIQALRVCLGPGFDELLTKFQMNFETKS